MSEQGAGSEATGEGTGAASAPSFDPAVITQGFESLRGDMEQMRQSFTQQNQAPAEEPAADEDFDLSFLDATNPDYDPGVQQQQLQQWQQQVLAQASAPAREAMAAIQQMRVEQEAAALVADFPELGQQETAENVVNGARQFGEQLISGLGLDQLGLPPQMVQQIAQRVGDSPAAWRTVFMASKAAQMASGESSAVDATFVEGGNGPGPGAPQQDPGDLIVGARGSNVLPF
jgi:hypothetical protein